MAVRKRKFVRIRNARARVIEDVTGSFIRFDNGIDKDGNPVFVSIVSADVARDIADQLYSWATKRDKEC